ncbi:hypothetical protein L249_3175 [Ophiocordyceps polyrhachis-furcata BCC 54312]|uniref:diphosphoinositol-polyphosphate diphosphatase n=1 Tax=Ophiocordyceps polyrhachis-furcata BCC 54312 TaxID=1330021 RepID=A0A367LNR8_9HYPO|nr:hypothetical protein L249_3175 [Ophiocordyceps polyrhachis-furcata BCC 54312]
MASKRNSRIYLDETALPPDSQPSTSSQRSRHGSMEKDVVQDAGDRQKRTYRDQSSTRSRAASLTRGELDTTTSTVTRSSSLTSDLSAGRPANFGVVLPHVYRSSYPQPENYAFLQSLKLKTVVTLVNKDGGDDSLKSFFAANGIRHVVFDMKGTKKEAIPPSTMSSILNVVMDHSRYPLLLHCNHGKHRTGCVVAVVRKLSGWSLDTILNEYRAYATPKVRECDVDYISRFHASTLTAVTWDTSPVQLRTFFRILIFSTFVAALWLISGSKLSQPSAHWLT